MWGHGVLTDASAVTVSPGMAAQSGCAQESPTKRTEVEGHQMKKMGVGWKILVHTEQV